MGNCIILYTQTVSDVDSDVVVQYRTEVGGDCGNYYIQLVGVKAHHNVLRLALNVT